MVADRQLARVEGLADRGPHKLRRLGLHAPHKVRVGPAQLLRVSERPVICAVNKLDGHSHEPLMYEFYSLGLETVLAVSAEHGRGVGTLLEEIDDWTSAGLLSQMSRMSAERRSYKLWPFQL